MLDYLTARIPKLWDFFFDAVYRRVLGIRACLWCLRKLNPEIRFIGTDANGEKTFLFTSDVGVTPITAAVSGFQKQEFARALTILQTLPGMSKKGIFMDVGANIGTQTIYAMRSGLFGSAICFEPVAENVDLLKLNLFANGLGPKTEVVPLALSDQAGSASIHISAKNCGDHRMETNSTNDGNARSIQTQTLDGFLQQRALSAADISLLWMDTQGHEAQVLQGSKSLALKGSFPWVMEFWPWAHRRNGSYDKFVELLQRNFAFFYDIQQKEMRKHAISTLSEYCGKMPSNERFCTDFLFLK